MEGAGFSIFPHFVVQSGLAPLCRGHMFTAPDPKQVAKTAQKNAALLRVASSLTEEREQDVHFLDAQVRDGRGRQCRLHDTAPVFL